MAITKEYIVLNEVEVDFVTTSPSTVVICPQYENSGRAIKVKLKNNGKDFPVPEGYTPYVYGVKFDQKLVDNLCEYDGNTVMVEVTKQLSAVKGRNIMRVALVNDETGEYAQTGIIYLMITDGADIPGAERSTDEFGALVQYMKQANASAEAAKASEVSAESDRIAAQTAMQNTLDAEGRVQAIVAGNESYTKQQSNDWFALALRGTVEAAKSITIYPDKGSNVVATLNGFTKQEGEGDASPVNVRPIVVGGNGAPIVKLDITTQTREGVSFSMTNGRAVRKGTATSAASGYRCPDQTWIPCKLKAGNYTAALMQTKDSTHDISLEALKVNDADEGLDSSRLFLLRQTGLGKVSYQNFTLSQDIEQMRVRGWVDYKQGEYYYSEYLFAIFEGHDNHSFPVEYTGKSNGLVISGVGADAMTAFAELTAPLCQGDKLITKMKSGCDKVVTLSTLSFGKISSQPHTFAALIDGITTSARPYSDVYHYYAKYDGNGFNINNLGVFITDFSCDTTEELKEQLSQSGARLWYRSADYTETNDIDISLETHSRWVKVMDGTEAYYQYRPEDNTETYFGFSTGLIPFVPKNPQSSAEISSHFKLGNATSSGYYPNTFRAHSSGSIYIRPEIDGVTSTETMQAYSKRQYDSGTPMAYEYELDTPAIFAHDPVNFITSPDEDGAWVITVEADGTVSAEFNKSITKALEELVQRVSALELNALGG